MEKIYEEKFNEKKSKTILKGRGILITSMLMVVIAVAAFVAAGFGNVSYAAPTDQLPETFTTVDPEMDIKGYVNENTYFTVNPYYDSEGHQVYCIDSTVDFVGNATYQKGDPLDDLGLMYLIANGYPAKSSVLGSGVTTGDATKDKYANIWVMQTAIWLYLNKPIEGGEALTQPIRTLMVDTGSGSVEDAITININNYDFRARAYALANEAKNHRSSTNFFKMNATGESKEDGDYFISGPINISADSSLQSYKVSLTTDVKDAQIINSSGTVIKDTDSLTSETTVLYIKVPKKSLGEGTTNITINGVAELGSLGGFVYNGTITGTNSPAQTLTDVRPTTTTISTNTTVAFKVIVDVPNTGMTTAQTIYFVGLVVLLCGVGIVYANVKPKEAE